MVSVQLKFFLVYFHYDCRTAEGDHEPDKDGLVHVNPIEQNTGYGAYGKQYLQSTAKEDGSPYLHEILDGEFQTDGKKQQYDANL